MKFVKKNWGKLGFFFLLSVLCLAATISDNTLRIGDGNPATDKTIQMGDGQLVWDGAESKLKFSNDAGLSSKDIGSGAGGGGGGLNLLADQNFDFESGDPPSNWAASGGAFVAGSPGFGSQSGSWNPSAASQNLDSNLVAIPAGLEGRACSAKVEYNFGGVTGDIVFSVLDNSSNVLSQVDLANTGGNWQSSNLSFICPTSASVRARFSSTADAANILLDDVHVGSDIVSVELSQSEVIAHATYAPTASCTWSRTNTVLGAFTSDADCPAITVNSGSGVINTTDNDLPDLVFSSLSPGLYIVEATMTGSCSGTASQGCTYAIRDQTDSVTIGQIAAVNSDATTPAVVSSKVFGSFTMTASGPKTLAIWGSASAASSVTVNLDNSTAGIFPTLNWKVYRFPLESQKALTLDQSRFSISAVISSGSPVLNLPQASYAVPSAATLQLVNDAGHNAAQIACTGTEEASGLTCSGTEQLGIAVNLPRAGKYKTCVSFHNRIETDSTTDEFETVWRISETQNAAQTVIQSASMRVSATNGDATVHAGDVGFPIQACGILQFNSAGKKTLRLEYTSAVLNGTAAGLSIAEKDSVTAYWEMIPIDVNLPMPVIIDTIATPGAGMQTAQYSARINVSGGIPSISTEVGDWIDSITDNGVGDFTINFKSGSFSSEPVCVVSGRNSSPNTIAVESSDTTLTKDLIRIEVGDEAGANFDASFSIQCHGIR